MTKFKPNLLKPFVPGQPRVGVLKSDDHVEQLLRRLHVDEKSKDLFIVSKSGVITKCHKAVFALVSPFAAQVWQIELNAYGDVLWIEPML